MSLSLFPKSRAGKIWAVYLSMLVGLTTIGFCFHHLNEEKLKNPKPSKGLEKYTLREIYIPPESTRNEIYDYLLSSCRKSLSEANLPRTPINRQACTNEIFRINKANLTLTGKITVPNYSK